MKILFYSHFFAPSVGGVETIARSQAAGLAGFRDAEGQAFEIVLVTQTDRGEFDDRSLSFPVMRRASLLQLYKLIRASDLVHIAGPSLMPLVLAKFAHKPVIVEHHGYQAVCPNGLLLYQPDKSVCPGHFQRRRYWKCLSCQASEGSLSRSLAGLLLTFPRNFLAGRASLNIGITHHVVERHALPRSVVIHYGIEDLCCAEGPAAQHDQQKVCFAFVGRLVAEKGITTLVQAAQKLTSEQHLWEIRLIGDGPERPNLENMIRRAHLENCVSITGYLTGSALSNALRDVHVVVMPSIWEETAGLAAIEQMMRGKLVIASDIGGLRQIVGDAGLRSAPGDADALAGCMRRVLRDPSLVDSLGRKARQRALSLFAQERMIQEHVLAYREVFQGKQAP
jgi:glycogen synthase